MVESFCEWFEIFSDRSVEMVLVPGKETGEFPVLLFIEEAISDEFVACFLPDFNLFLHEFILFLIFIPGVDFFGGVAVFIDVILQVGWDLLL